MPRLKLTIAYVGTKYSGWQRQSHKGVELPTIQGIVEKEISRICDTKIYLQGSGRTDAGVHADCQTTHCDIPENKISLNWQLALNTCLPHDIRIKNYAIVNPSFHAMFDVEKKSYTYSLWLNRQFVPPKLYPFTWACGELDIKKIDEAIPYLLGKHDFAFVQNQGTEIKSTERIMYEITRSDYDKQQNLDPENYELKISFTANGFLKQMVRNLVGLLVACGKGKIDPRSIPQLIATKDRKNSPPTAPPQGLTMTQIWYKQNEQD